MKFSLTIELGNDAMSTTNDLAGALLRLSRKLNNYDTEDLPNLSGSIRDENGNKVGKYSVITDEE